MLLPVCPSAITLTKVIGKMDLHGYTGETNKISLQSRRISHSKEPGEATTFRPRSDRTNFPASNLKITVLPAQPKFLSLKLTRCKHRRLGRVHMGAWRGAQRTTPHLPIDLRVGRGTTEERAILEFLSGVFPPHPPCSMETT